MVTSKQPELPDDRMIQDTLNQNPLPAWLWLALVAVAAALIWGGASWYWDRQSTSVANSPFLQVTNRDFSVFLWEFPEYMRANVSGKTGYLPDFKYQDKVSIEPGKAEEYVSAPPQVLFLYHTWKRLIANEFAARPISVRGLREFLEYAEEWQPKNWPNAPKEYAELVKSLPAMGTTDLHLSSIPKEVQQAYIGWKNFMVEGDLINQMKPTYGDVDEFIKLYPHYARNYWRNLVMSSKPDYLKTYAYTKYDPKTAIPENELSAFLKVALFNYMQAKKNL